LARYFIDTSALAKLYRREPGSDVIDRVFAESGSQLFVSRLALVEMESVFALKTRKGEINQQALILARRRLGADLGSSRLFVASIGDSHFRFDIHLLIKFGVFEGLRTLDALQLSVAAGLRNGGLPTVFVAADQRLCRVAALEGFAVINPEQPASLVV
jgi:predicted nucleic acid-binding protein